MKNKSFLNSEFIFIGVIVFMILFLGYFGVKQVEEINKTAVKQMEKDISNLVSSSSDSDLKIVWMKERLELKKSRVRGVIFFYILTIGLFLFFVVYGANRMTKITKQQIKIDQERRNQQIFLLREYISIMKYEKEEIQSLDISRVTNFLAPKSSFDTNDGKYLLNDYTINYGIALWLPTVFFIVYSFIALIYFSKTNRVLTDGESLLVLLGPYIVGAVTIVFQYFQTWRTKRDVIIDSQVLGFVEAKELLLLSDLVAMSIESGISKKETKNAVGRLHIAGKIKMVAKGEDQNILMLESVKKSMSIS